ncbi:MAG: TetR/AcrR family transcriptional regulator [Spirochaetales bacterium]|nr:TetR/AcrR family transcriptional regulator [Spirochaetales bacterium]MBP7262783.1 TetR/AcrR family transcriptional regulator [Spirochaetia bacterium]
MARERDESKRLGILAEAKRLFAERGFHATSVQDIVKGVDLPVGTVYTYFQNKDDIIRTAIDEGWSQFYDEVERACAAEPSPAGRMALIVDSFLPRLLADVEFISLIMSDGLRYTDINDKLERLGALIGSVVNELARERGMTVSLSPKQAITAIAVFFLGSMDTIRVARMAGLSLGERDVMSFIRLVIEGAFRISLPKVAPAESVPPDAGSGS